MAAPHQKNHPLFVIIWNTILVTIVFYLVGLGFYAIVSPGANPYAAGILNKILYSLPLCFAFAFLYNKAANVWAGGSKKTFVFKNPDGEGSLNNLSCYLNGLVFSLLTWVGIIFSIALMDEIIMTVYVHFLAGFKGTIPPPDEREAAALALQLALAGAAVQSDHTGQTEEKPRY